MRSTHTILVALLAVLLAGCVVRGKQQTAKNLPPPPLPAPKVEPAPPAEPLSIPQTNVTLPPPQPVSPEAVAAAQPPGESLGPPVTPPHATGGTRRPSGPPPIAAPKAETAAPAATTPPPETSAPIQEIVPPNEQRRLQETANSRKHEVRQWLDQTAGRRLNRHQAGIKKTIESYLKLSDQAETKGDMRQASELAERAWTLMKDLQGGR